MKLNAKKYFLGSLVCAVLCTGFSLPTYAIDLNGLMTIEPKVMERVPLRDENGDIIINPETGEPVLSRRPVFISGSYFVMSNDIPNNGTSIEGGSAGGIILNTYQRFILDPDVPNPPRGTGYGRTPVVQSTAMSPFSFFGVATYTGTNSLSYQSGVSKPVVSATVDVAGNLTVELSSWEVMWNGSAFEQGPRASAAAGFTPAYGTYDFETGKYVIGWLSKIVGGPFSGVPAYWHLEGTILADPVNADAVAGPQTLNIKSKGNGFTVDLSLTDTDGTVIDPANINEGVSITSIGATAVAKGLISENVAGRVIVGDTLVVAFDDPATGSRQDIIAAISDASDGSSVTVCASGTTRDAGGILRPFEGCDDIVINNKGNH